MVNVLTLLKIFELFTYTTFEQNRECWVAKYDKLLYQKLEGFLEKRFRLSSRKE